MRSQYTCLSCLVKQSRHSLSRSSLTATSAVYSFVGASSRCLPRERASRWSQQTSCLPNSRAYHHIASIQTSHSTQVRYKRSPRTERRSYASALAEGPPLRFHGSGPAEGPSLKLAPDADRCSRALANLKRNINHGVSSKDGRNNGGEDMRIEQALSLYSTPSSDLRQTCSEDEYQQVATVIGEHFAGKTYTIVKERIRQILVWRTSSGRTRQSMLQQDPSLAGALAALGFAQPKALTWSRNTQKLDTYAHDPLPDGSDQGESTEAPLPVHPVISSSEDEGEVPSSSFRSLKASQQTLEAIQIGSVEVPKLSFDLSRVLFNPGVYQLRDPRSRVYNFDPYLEKIMPVTEFNFEALNKYITSSEDNTLRDLAIQRQRRYIGSSSSMTSTLAHFHFLLSTWRSINVNTLSRGFKAESDNFTRFQRAPTAVFLRYQNGVYAMDADKEFDDATVLLSLGRSMEKLLTLEKSDYEKLRKSNAIQSGQFELAPEQYHYSEIGPFLMRSQLDAHDPRLPGTGMFDLKTRAVIAVRMTMADQKGTGYEIKHRHGTWESFEREYYDMMRSAFLKYSLQVRMGRMDGVFVAFHNIERIFGFQYISLAEMDRALHGQTDRTLGDQEFQFSVRLLTELFDRATKEFPEQSLRFHFETRESSATKTEAKPWMYVFAEPVSEEEIERIQTSRSKEVKEAEERILSGQARLPREANQTKPESNAADTDFLDSLDQIKIEPEPIQKATETPKVPLLGMKVVVQSRVGGLKTIRPVDLTENETWELDYSITDMPQTQAQGKYTQCKNRRSIMFGSSRDRDVSAEGYLSRLIDMSEAGAAWRKERDELDAAKERVVLYDGHTSNREAEMSS